MDVDTGSRPIYAEKSGLARPAAPMGLRSPAPGITAVY